MLAEQGFIARASGRNWACYAADVVLSDDLPDWQRLLLADPQTSGGLLVACAPEKAVCWSRGSASRVTRRLSLAKTPSPRVTCCSPCSNQLQKLRRESLHSWEQPSSRVSNNRVYASTPASQGRVAPTKNAVAAWAGVRPEATAEYVALQPPESVPRGEHLEALLRPNLVPAKRGLSASAVAEAMSQLASVRL